MYTRITQIGGGVVQGGGGGGSPGEDDDDDNDGGDGGEFNAIEFLTSPLGMVLIGGSVAGVVVIIAIIKIKGSGKSRTKEIERIKKLKEE